MVVGLARDNLHLSDAELSQLASDIREGDMSVLLKEYEKEIKVKLYLVIDNNHYLHSNCRIL